MFEGVHGPCENHAAEPLDAVPVCGSGSAAALVAFLTTPPARPSAEPVVGVAIESRRRCRSGALAVPLVRVGPGQRGEHFAALGLDALAPPRHLPDGRRGALVPRIGPRRSVASVPPREPRMLVVVVPPLHAIIISSIGVRLGPRHEVCGIVDEVGRAVEGPILRGFLLQVQSLHPRPRRRRPLGALRTDEYTREFRPRDPDEG